MNTFKSEKLQAMLRDSVAKYIKYLDNQSPICGDSHHMLRGLYDIYGKEKVDAECDRQFNATSDALNFIIDTTDKLLNGDT